MEQFYNVWYIEGNRWTNHNEANDIDGNLIPISREQAEDIAKRLTSEGATFVARPFNIMIHDGIDSTIINSSVPVNDYTCTVCKNNKCSKTEKSCWKCGAQIPIQK